MKMKQYRPINQETDLGKNIEVRNSRHRSWTRGYTLTGIITEDGVVVNYIAGGKVWDYARILLKEAPPQEPKTDDDLYREAHYGDRYKKVQVRSSVDSPWLDSQLLDVNFNHAEPYQTKERQWTYARILKEEPEVKNDDDLYRKAHYGDKGKKVEVRDSEDGFWLQGQLLDVNFGCTKPFQTKEAWWQYARIRKEEPANPPAPPQEKPLQSHVAARFDCIDPVVLKLLAECLGYGAKKYYPYSYLRIPVEDHINHALNHINEHRRLSQDKTQKPEDELHLVNALARITFAISCLAKQGSYPDTYSHPEKLNE
jgi:Domain of unknown function (DUF5664)